MKEDVNFGIIPCGSGNGLAFAAKIPKQPAKALDIIFTGKASAIDGFMSTSNLPVCFVVLVLMQK